MRWCVFTATIVALSYAPAILGDQLVVLNVPPSVKLSNQKSASISDVQALPHQLFGLDESQSRILSDVSFFRRPSLFAVITLSCGSQAAACADDVTAGVAAPRIRLDSAGDAGLLVFQAPGSLAEAVAAARLDKSLLASTASLTDASHPSVFAGLDIASASEPLADEAAAGVPDDLARRMRLARAAVDRAIASGMLADSQPDALQIDLVAAADLPAAVRQRVAKFARGLADQLAEAAGRDRAFVAVLVVDSATASADAGPQLVRVGRALMAATDAPVTTVAPSGSMNLAPDYDPDFPIMFNLILWLSVVLALTVYAVAYGLWNIDPGKDSIIYRRGYAHAKKD